MSLIHDALKKAEAENKSSDLPKNFLNNPILPSGKQRASKPTMLLIVLLGASLLFLFTTRVLKKSQKPFAPQPGLSAGTMPAPEDPIQLKQTALQLFNQNKFEASLALWEKLTLLFPTEAEVYNNMGLTLKKLGRKEEAYEAYTKALALKRDYPELLNNLGVLYLTDGNKEKAKNYFQEALNLSKEYADPALHLALIFEQEGNAKQALENYRQFLKLSAEIDKGLLQKIENKMSRLSK